MIKILSQKPKDDVNILSLSVSKVKTFTTCKAQYRFNYIEKLPQKDWEHLIFGKFLHAVLELFHKILINGSNEPYHKIMMSCFNQALITYKSLSSESKKDGFNILSKYLKFLYEQQKLGILPTFLSVEKNFYIGIDDVILLNGFIDRIQIDADGVIHVADYKTTKNKKYLKNDFFQLLTYAYVLCLEDPNLKKVRGSYILLRHDFEMISKDFEREEIMEIESKFIDYAEKIKSEKLFRASPSPLCKFCSFIDHCEEGLRSQNGINPSSKFGEMGW